MNEIGPDELPANLVRKCDRCNDFTGEMRSVIDTYQQRIQGSRGLPMAGGAQTHVGRDYRFKCTKCGAEFMVPGGESVLSFAGLGVVGLVVMGAGLSQGLWFTIPIGLLMALPVAWALYQRKKHPGMF